MALGINPVLNNHARFSQSVVLLPIEPEQSPRSARLKPWAQELMNMGKKCQMQCERFAPLVFPLSSDLTKPENEQLFLKTLEKSAKKITHLSVLIPGHSSPLGVTAEFGGSVRVTPEQLALSVANLLDAAPKQLSQLRSLSVNLLCCNTATPAIGTCAFPEETEILNPEALKQLILKTSFAGRFLHALNGLVRQKKEAGASNLEKIDVTGLIGYYCPYEGSQRVPIINGVVASSTSSNSSSLSVRAEHAAATLFASLYKRHTSIDLALPKKVLPVQPDWFFAINNVQSDSERCFMEEDLETIWAGMNGNVPHDSELWELVRPADFGSQEAWNQYNHHRYANKSENFG